MAGVLQEEEEHRYAERRGPVLTNPSFGTCGEEHIGDASHGGRARDLSRVSHKGSLPIMALSSHPDTSQRSTF
jgi:hypothetical protein